MDEFMIKAWVKIPNEEEKRAMSEQDNDKQPLMTIVHDIGSLKQKLQGLQQNIKELNEQVKTIKQNIVALKNMFSDENIGLLRYVTSTNSAINNIKPVLGDINQNVKKIDKMEEAIGNIDYNIRNGISGGNNDGDYIRSLQGKLSEFEDDLYLKLMRKYVVDSQISLYVQIAERNYYEKDEKLETILRSFDQKLQSIGIKTTISQVGDTFNPQFMTTGHYPNVATTDENMDGKIAASVHPSFVWTLPTIRQRSAPLLLKEEEVILYHYSKKEEQNN